MKRTLLAAGLAVAMMAGQADAFTLPLGDFELKLTGYTSSVEDNAGAINTWSIFRLTSAQNNSGDPLWNQSDNDYVFGAIWGLTDKTSVYNPSTSQYTVEMQGGQFAMFSGSGNMNNNWLNLVTGSATDGLDAAEVASLFSGYTQILSGDFSAGKQGSTTDTTIVATTTGLTTPATGSGHGYVDVTGGTLGQMFDSNSSFSGTDLELLYDLTMIKSSDPGNGIWGAKLQDPVTGTAVPEPSTMMLLGAGVLGLGLYGRRRAKREA